MIIIYESEEELKEIQKFSKELHDLRVYKKGKKIILNDEELTEDGLYFPFDFNEENRIASMIAHLYLIDINSADNEILFKEK